MTGSPMLRDRVVALVNTICLKKVVNYQTRKIMDCQTDEWNV
jgi:hypothetical protein